MSGFVKVKEGSGRHHSNSGRVGRDKEKQLRHKTQTDKYTGRRTQTKKEEKTAKCHAFQDKLIKRSTKNRKA